MILPGGGMRDQNIIQHLVELRTRLIRCLIAVTVIFIALYPFANELYTLAAQPLLKHLPAHASMIATDVTSPFMAPLKLSLVASLFAAIPFVLYQVWAFVAPGLYRDERRFALPLLVASVLLFYMGALFAYFLVFPMIFGFFTSVAPQGVTVMTDINSYLDFVLTLFFVFGVVFEVPVITVLLVRGGIVTPDTLARNRPYIIVGAFVIGMLLTPPDVFSQTFLAVPMWMLFELGLWLSRMEMFGGKQARHSNGHLQDD